jgi:hypothetical protein
LQYNYILLNEGFYRWLETNHYKQNKTKLKKENTAHAVQKKTACGEFGNVFLTKNELEKLKSQYPQEFEAIIDYLSSYIEMKGYKAKSHYLAIQKWVVLVIASRKCNGRQNNKFKLIIYCYPVFLCLVFPLQAL